MQCFLCDKSRNVIKFTDDRLEKCYKMLAFRKKKQFKYQDIVLPRSLQYKGYHMLCYNRFVVLKRQNRKEYESMVANGPFDQNYQEPDTSSILAEPEHHLTMETTITTVTSFNDPTKKQNMFSQQTSNQSNECIPIDKAFNIDSIIESDIHNSGILKSILTRNRPIKKDISIDRGHLWNHLNQTYLNPPTQN